MNRRTLLTISLLLNVLLVGFVAGQSVSRLKPAEPKPPTFETWLADAGLSPEERQTVSQRLKSLRDSSKASRDASQKAREEILKTLSAKEYDHAAYNHHAQYMLELRQQSRARMVMGMGELAKDLNHAQRSALADVIRRYDKERDKCSADMRKRERSE